VSGSAAAIGRAAPEVAEVRRAVRTAVAALPGPYRSAPLLVACSGGADSVALAAAAVALRGSGEVHAAVVDHGLQDGSAEQAAAVVELLSGLGAVASVHRVEVSGTGGVEAAARRARYGALRAARPHERSPVLLGHTLDDQAETVLLGLGRGSGPRSIAGMAPRDGRWLRPLLRLRRATTVAACAALGFTPWQDPHNADPAFQRARLRTEALPLLEDVLQGGVAEALARTADLLRDDLASLDAWADSVISTAGDPLVVAALADLPRAVRTRALRAWAATHGAAPLSAERTAALDGLLVAWRGQGPIDLPGGVLVRRTSGTLEAYPLASETPESRTPPAPQE
jgi:tRNA(Ile)-lysidine synthase